MKLRQKLQMFTIIAAPLALAACEDEPEVAVEDDGRDATGEILEGSISDDMLQIEDVRSQAPLREPDPAAAGSDDDGSAPASAEPEE